MKQMSENLPIKLDPTRDIIPDNWWREVVLPWSEEQTDAALIREAAAKLSAYEHYYRIRKLDALELLKAIRVLEVRWGELMPPDEPWRKIRGKKSEQRCSDNLPHMDQARFRQLAAHKEIVFQILSAVGDTGHLSNGKLTEIRELEKRLGRSAILKEIAKLKRQEKLKRAVYKAGESFHIYKADMTTWMAPHQYDFIITDPPYPKEFLPLYEKLAKRANEWLKPTGLLIAMCGQSYFDQILRMMTKHLKYYWLGAYLLPGQPTPLRQVQVNCSWKPLIILRPSGESYKGKIFGDVFRSEKPEKENHNWGQSVSGMDSIVKKICIPGQYILDPFCGAGSAGIAALMNECFFDGVEIDPATANRASERLAELCQEM